MTIEQAIHDLKILLQALTDDTRIKDEHLIYKLNNYREIIIKEYFTQNFHLPETCWQRIGLKELTPVGIADNSVTGPGSVKFGKTEIPAVMDIYTQDKIITIKANKPNSLFQIYPINKTMLFSMIESKQEFVDKFSYFFYEDGNIKVYPFTPEIEIAGILQNPREASVYETEQYNPEDLVVGTQYTVINRTVVQNLNSIETVYKKDESFICQNLATYSGEGKLRKTNQIRSYEATDRYPLPAAMLQDVIIRILTVDFQIEKQNVIDVINDSIDQFKLLMSNVGNK